MSTSITNVQQIEFDELVKDIYHSRGQLLMGTVRTKSNVIGYATEFRRVDQVIAVATGYGQALTPQDPNYSKVTCVIQKYTAPTFIDTVQELTVNFDVKMENAMLVGYAMGRRTDQITIDALDADAGTTIAAGGTNMNYEKFTEVFENFERNAVPKGERFIALSASNLRSLMQDDQFVSLFYTRNAMLDTGIVYDYMGIRLITIPDMTEGGLPLAGNIRTALAWHKMSTGMAIGHNISTEIHYLPDRTSWLVNGLFSAGAKVIDNRGVFKILCDESV